MKAAPSCALYVGEVRHQRLRPRRHGLRYRLFMLLIDLDEAAALDRLAPWFSVGRFNLASFHSRDHGEGSERPLRRQIEERLQAGGLGIDGGPIRLLAMPRILGFVFNPLSIYFCHCPGGELHAILYEVTSTFGERHSYLIAAHADPGGIIRQEADKRLHVSPFLDMGLRYRFRLAAPGETLNVEIAADDEKGPILWARLTGARRALTGRALLKVLAAQPLMTLKVVVAIHFEALKLVAKGLRMRGGPRAPPCGASVGRPAGVQTRRR